MASFRTHYQNLKVDREAAEGVIKAAYKALTFKYHPDRNPDRANAEKTFKLIRESYEVLIDPVSRRKHDEWIARQEAKTKRNQRDTYTEGGREEKKREREKRGRNKAPQMHEVWPAPRERRRPDFMHLCREERRGRNRNSNFPKCS